MMNDDLRDMMPTSEEFYADAKAEFGEVVELDQPTAEVQRESEELDRQLENAYKCDDDNDSYGTYADDAVDHTTGNNPEYNAYLDAFNLTPIAEYLPNNK